MNKIIYEEFGVRSEITEYTEIGSKLKGMKEGKPFVHKGEIRINLEGKLYRIDEIKFFDNDDKELGRKEVCLDTENRIAGVFVNSKNEILLLSISRDRQFYCFPGGHRRECESVEECLKREMMEETSIDIAGFESEILLEMQEDGFGPESFFLINMGEMDIVYQDEDSTDTTSKLEVHKIDEIFKYENVFPGEVIQKLKELYQHEK